MRVHWYWPFARAEELAWAVGTARHGDSIVVQVIDRDAAPTAGRHGQNGNVVVERTLRDVVRTRSTGVGWIPSRARTYRQRAVAREDVWRQQPIDVVHVHYLNRFTDSLSRFPHPLVFSVHDVTPHEPRLGRQGEHVLLRQLYRRADALVVHHRMLRERLVDDFGIASSRVHVVPHQVFPTAPGSLETAPARRPMVLMFGALRGNKGLEVLERALPLIRDLDLCVVIAGRGDARLEDAARALAARDSRVQAEIGFASLNRKRQLFSESSVVVLPYTAFASQSGVLHDAYGHARPVVVSDVGALGDAVRQDGTGLVTAPGDADDLANAIASVLKPAAWARYSDAAKRVTRQRSPEQVGAELRRIYDLLL